MDTPAPAHPVPRITFVLANLKGGGAERMTLRLASGVAATGLDTELILFNRTGELSRSAPPHLQIVDLGQARSRSSILPLARHLRKRQPTAILTTLHHTSTVVTVAVKLARINTHLIIREANHLGRFTEGKPAWQALLLPHIVRWTFNQANLLTAVSNDLRAELHDFLRTDFPAVVTRYNPVVNAELFESASAKVTHRWLSADRNDPTIITAGRLVPQKDHETLLRAFSLLRHTNSAKLLIYGDGPERSSLEALIHELGLQQHVELPGYDRNLPAALARADLFVLSSQWEGLPAVLIQAMALGVPVVSTDCPTGPSEILEQGRWGELVPVREPKKLADAMLKGLEGNIPSAPLKAIERFKEEAAIARCVRDLSGML